MTVSDGELSDKVLTFVLIHNHIFFGGAANKQVSLGIGLSLLNLLLPTNPIVIRDTIIRTGLFMLIPLLIMVVLIMHRVIKTKTIHIPRGAGGDDVSVVEGDDELLDEVA
jgi:hypothetical protein